VSEIIVNPPATAEIIVTSLSSATIEISNSGPQGASGSKIYSGVTAPDPEIGAIGDYWFDKVTKQMYGPKSQEDGWGVPIPLGGNPTLADSVFSIDNPDDGDSILYNQGTDTWEARPTRYIHNQVSASPTWIINHNLNANPGGVSIVDSAGSTVYGDIVYNSLNRLTATFTVSFSGKAYIS
jgi:hypothetical protein